MKIEIILLGVIGVIILLDFLLKRSKKRKELVEVDVAKKQQNITSNLNRFLFAFITSLISSPILSYTIDSYNSRKFLSLDGYISTIKFDLLPHITNFTILFIISFILFRIGFVKTFQYLFDRSRLSLNQNKSSSRIRKLEILYKDGVITEEEYKSKKEEIRKDLLNDI